jgi:hypothetical protein
MSDQHDREREHGLLLTGHRYTLTPDLAFTKTALHNLQGGLELCGGTLHTPQGDHAVCWDTDDQDDVTVTLLDGTVLLSSGMDGRHHALVGGSQHPV